MKITSVKKHRGSGMWYGHAISGDKNYEWFNDPARTAARKLHVREQDKLVRRAWMNVEPPKGAKQAVLKAVREARS